VDAKRTTDTVQETQEVDQQETQEVDQQQEQDLQQEEEVECNCIPAETDPCPCYARRHLQRRPWRVAIRDESGLLKGPPIVATPEVISCGEGGCFMHQPPPPDHVQPEIVDHLNLPPPPPPTNTTNATLPPPPPPPPANDTSQEDKDAEAFRKALFEGGRQQAALEHAQDMVRMLERELERVKEEREKNVKNEENKKELARESDLKVMAAVKQREEENQKDEEKVKAKEAEQQAKLEAKRVAEQKKKAAEAKEKQEEARTKTIERAIANQTAVDSEAAIKLRNQTVEIKKLAMNQSSSAQETLAEVKRMDQELEQASLEAQTQFQEEATKYHNNATKEEQNVKAQEKKQQQVL